MKNYKNIFIEKLKKNNVSEEGASSLLASILLFRNISHEIRHYPERVVENIFNYPLQSDTVFYPCDIIDLRQVFMNDSIFHQKQICLFSFGLAKKYLNGYCAWIGLSREDLDGKDVGGILILDDNISDVKKKIKRIYVNEELNPQYILDINKIITEECPEIDLDVLGNIEALKEPIIAKNKEMFNLKKLSQQIQSNKVSLTPKEEQIFDFLIQCKNLDPRAQKVELRVAGGWTRDKLLGLESDDIDIAISRMSGIEFANIISTYAKRTGVKDVSDAHEISLEKLVDTEKPDANPQLLVGGLSVFGQKIEFVPMRTETYTKNSRTPHIQRTDNVQEDVIRRDLTINAIYYNIETKQIEDYVGGIKDLKTMTLKTPVDPVKTFQEDPLRMLRVLRFYSKFPDSTIDDSVLKALQNPEVQAFYGPPKLAHERASKEFIKMMEGSRPAEAARIMFETGLYKKVLLPDPQMREIAMDQQNPHHQYNVMNHILSVIKNTNEIAKESNMPQRERGWLNLAALFHDFGKLYPEIQTEHPKKPGHMQYIGHEDKSTEFAKKVMTTMGFDQDVKKFVIPVIQHHMWPFSFHKGMSQQTMDKHIGKFLHQVGDLYERIVQHSHADVLGKGDIEEQEALALRQEKQKQVEMLRKYKEEVGDLINKTVIDGNEIRSILQSVAPELVKKNAFFDVKGKKVHYMSFIIDKIMEQQWLRTVSTPEQARDFINKNARNWTNMWNQQQTEKQKNITQQPHTKKADASSVGSDVGLSPALERNREIRTMDYSAVSPFKVGDKVRLRSGGLSFSQIQGRVTKIDTSNNMMIVSLQTGKYAGKEIKVDLLDAVKLSMNWEKI